MPRTKKSPVDFTGRPVWAEVSLSALRQNFQAIRDYVNPPSEKRKSPRKVLSIVKGNGYGHGGPQSVQGSGAIWLRLVWRGLRR